MRIAMISIRKLHWLPPVKGLRCGDVSLHFARVGLYTVAQPRAFGLSDHSYDVVTSRSCSRAGPTMKRQVDDVFLPNGAHCAFHRWGKPLRDRQSARI